MSALDVQFQTLQLSDAIFKDVKFYTTGSLLEKVEELLKAGGAERMNYFSDFVTHLICGDEPEETDITDATDLYEIPAVVPRWVYYSAKLNQILPTKPYLYNPQKLFTNLIFCFSGVSEDRNTLWAIITYHGGSAQLNLDQTCTHLVTTNTNSEKYLKAESLSEQITIVTPDWVFETARYKNFADAELFHPRLIAWPKKPESTTAITGFEEQTQETLEQQETGLQQALLEKLKQRMPWNQPQVTNSEIPPPNVVAPSYASTKLPQPQELNQQRLFSQKSLPFGQQLNFLPASNQIPRSIVHHTPQGTQQGNPQGGQQLTPEQQAQRIRALEQIQQNRTLQNQLNRIQQQQQQQNQFPQTNQQGRSQQNAELLLRTSSLRQLMSPESQQIVQNIQNVQHTAAQLRQNAQNLPKSAQQQILQRQLSQQQLKNQLLNQQLLQGQQNQQQLLQQGQQNQQLLQQGQQNQQLLQQGQQNQQLLQQGQQNQQLLQQGQQNQQLLQQGQQNQQLLQQGQQNQQLLQQGQQNPQLLQQGQQNQLLQQNQQQSQQMLQQGQQNQLVQQGQQNQQILQQGQQNQLLQQQGQQNPQLLQQGQQNQQLLQQGQSNQLLQQNQQQGQQMLQQSQQNQLVQQGQQNQQLLQGQPNQQLLQQSQQNQLLQQNQQQQSQQQRLMQQNQPMLQQGQQREQLLQQNQQLLPQNQQLLQGQQSQQLLKGQAQQLLRSQQQILTSQSQQILQGSQQQVLQTSQAQQLLLQQQNQQQLLQSQQTQQQLLQNQQNQQHLLQNQQNQQQLLQNQQNQQQLLQNQQGQQQLLQNQPGQQQLLQNRQLLQLQNQQNLLQEQQNQQLLQQQGQQQLQNQIMQNQQQGSQQQHGQQMIQTSQAGQQLLQGQQQMIQGQQLLQGAAGKQQLLQRQQSVSGEMLVSPQGQQMLQGQQQRLLQSPQQSQLLLRGQQTEILQSPQTQQMLQSPQQSQLLQSPLQESTPGQQQQLLSPQMLSQQQILQSPTNNPLLQGQLMQGQAGQQSDILQAQQSQQLDLNQRQHMINQQAALRSNLGQQLIQNKLQMQQQQQQGQQFQNQQFPPQTQNFAQNPNQPQQFLQNPTPQLINQQKLNQQQILTQQKQILLNQQGQQFQGGQPGQQRPFIWQQGQGQPQQQQIQRQLVQGGPRVQWVPGQQPGVAPQRQFIQLDAETHKQLQQMTPEERTVFVQKLHKQRQLLYSQGRVGPQNQQRPSHILIRGGVPPEQQMQWIQQQTKQQGVILQQQQPQTIQPQNVPQPPAPPNQQQVAPPLPQPTPGLSPLPQPNYDQNQQHMLLRQKQLQLQQLQQQQQQQQQQQAAAQQKKAHEQLGSQQGVVSRPGPLGPQGGAPPPQVPIDPNSDQNPLVVNPKTKTALANMLNTRLQSGGNIGDPGLPEQPSAAGTLRLMTAQHNAALNSTSRPPQDILAMQRGRLISRTNGDMIRAPVPPVGAPGPPAAEPAKLQFSPRTAVPAQHRPGPYYGHNPNLKLPPDQFLLGCVFVVVEVERYLEESNPGWQKKIEKFGGEIEKQYCSRVTHVICETQRHGVVMQALRDFKRCVTLFWLADVLQKKQVLPPWIALHLPTMYWDASPGAKHLISIGGFTELDRDRVKHMIKYIGASMTTYFSKHNTLLVMTKPEGSKYAHAKKWGTPVVSVNWLTDVMLGHFSALNQLEHIKYQNFAEPSNFSFDPTLVPNLMQAWKMPINISQETFEKIKRAAPTPLQSAKLKKPKLEMVTDENDNEENINPNAAHRILFSMCPDVEELKKIVRNLGGTVVKSYKDCTHLVMPTLIRTHKLLCCVTVGVHIVPDSWIRDSQASGRFIDESQHTFDTKEFNREFDCDFSRILTVKCRDRLFDGKYFYVTPSVRPSKRDIVELIQLCGGVVERIRRSQAQIEATNVNSPYSYVILTHELDLHLVADLLRNKKDKVRIVCNSELVMSAILRQTFEVEQYAVRIL